MKLQDKHLNIDYTEVTLLLSAIIAPVFAFIGLKMDLEVPMHLKWLGWIVTLSFTFVYILMYKIRFIRQYLKYFLYGEYYLLSIFAVYLAFYYSFSESYSLFLMLIIFYITLTFEKIKSLFCYLASTLVLIILAVYIKWNYSYINVNNAFVVSISSIIFSLIVILNLYRRNVDKWEASESKKDYQRLLDVLPDGILVNTEGKIAYANEAFVKLIKLKGKDELIGKSAFQILHKKDYEKNLAGLQEIINGNKEGYNEIKANFFNDVSVDVEIANIITTYNGKKAILTVIRDISERKRMEEELIEAESKYRNIVEGALAGVYLILNSKLIYVNKYYADTFGYSVDEIYNTDVFELISEEYWELVDRSIQELLSGIKEVMLELKGIRKDRSILYVMVHAKSILYKGQPAIIGTLIDITEQKKSEEKIREMALYDAVTGLPNRYFLSIYLEKNLEESKESDSSVALMFIDLDRFKIINDTMGHSFGDKVLKEVSAEIKARLYEHCFISRYGGDEFVIVLKNTSINKAEQAAKNIIEAFTVPLTVEGHNIDTTPSIGISVYPLNCGDAETLIKQADTAMYEAKYSGRNNFKFYKPEMNYKINRKVQLESRLRTALQNDEFIIYYQPQVDIISGNIYGAEALIRWQHPDFGLVPPNEFIPLAEETGFIIPLGEWVLKTACMQIMAWRKLGMHPFNIAVNVSYKQLVNEGFISLIQEALRESNLEPEYLELEITESILKDIKELKVILDKIKPIGVKLSIDDFGVGYSSLSVLQHTAINNLKIDRSFISNMLSNDKSANIVKTIIELGKNIDCTIIAEGIENKEQADFLTKNNCDIGQGYLFSRPLDVEGFEKFLEIGD